MCDNRFFIYLLFWMGKKKFFLRDGIRKEYWAQQTEKRWRKNLGKDEKAKGEFG